MGNSHICVDKVTYKYPDDFKAIDEISFSVNVGEKIGIIGVNGAGKSTILQLLTGLFTATEGKIFIDNIEFTKKTLRDIRKKIGFIFQDSDNQLFMNTVYEDIAFGLRSGGLEEYIVKEKVEDIIKQMNIEHLTDKSIYKLSGGQKRMVAIAGILVMNPRILLMDEPTAALDPKSRRILINTLKELPQTNIIATHDLDMIMDLCSRVIILNNGKVVADGIVDNLLRDKELMEKCNLELPLSLQNKI
nr:ABC transporter ATP-binding protein [Clostridium cylindrosporum]